MAGNREAVEATIDLVGIGLGVVFLVQKFGPLRAGAGLYALDQLVFKRMRAENARKHGGIPARSWDL